LTASAQVVVLGLGNLLHSDDSVGARALQRLQADCRVPPEVALVEGGTLGLALLAHIWDASYLLVLDAVNVGRAPGSVIRLAGDALHSLPGNGSVHQLGLADILAALRALARTPPEVVVLGVQPETTEWGTELSPPVQAALEPLTEAALAELSRARQASGRRRRKIS
jgi:hydrogenase maturation protease